MTIAQVKRRRKKMAKDKRYRSMIKRTPIDKLPKGKKR